MFSPLSLEITKSFPKDILKEYGIYFTPKPIIDASLTIAQECCEEFGIHITEILEPSCGSGEFALSALERFPNSLVDCVEYNRNIYEKIAHLQRENPRMSIYNADYLKWIHPTNSVKKYDLIIGNPPYFVIKKEDVSKTYHPYLQGRPNIYIVFILRSLEMLAENGILSFVVPTNFLNCTYYLKTREYILSNFVIKSIVLCDEGKFLDTTQQTFILTIVKISSMEPLHILERNDSFKLLLPNRVVILNTPERIAELKHLYNNSITLEDLDINVSVGTVVWNQSEGNMERKRKEEEEEEKTKTKTKKTKTKKETKKQSFELSDDPSDTLLIYSNNIIDGQFVEQNFDNVEKKCYIKKEGITGPMMVINRGYGKGVYKMNYCILDIGRPFLIENHLICLTPTEDIGRDLLMDRYRLIERSLNDPRTSRFIELYFGNSAINCTELKSCFPIYV
jgi:adenine-specific DNA-methyltransferase